MNIRNKYNKSFLEVDSNFRPISFVRSTCANCNTGVLLLPAIMFIGGRLLKENSYKFLSNNMGVLFKFC